MMMISLKGKWISFKHNNKDSIMIACIHCMARFDSYDMKMWKIATQIWVVSVGETVSLIELFKNLLINTNLDFVSHVLSPQITLICLVFPYKNEMKLHHIWTACLFGHWLVLHLCTAGLWCVAQKVTYGVTDLCCTQDICHSMPAKELLHCFSSWHSWPRYCAVIPTVSGDTQRVTDVRLCAHISISVCISSTILIHFIRE